MGPVPQSRYIFGSLPWYSVLVVTGMALAVFLASREEKRLGLPPDTTVDLALFIIPLGVIGARLYYVLFSWHTFAARPWRALYLWEGGLAIYGGVLGGALGVWLFSRRKKLSMPVLLDMIVPGLALAQGIGRWGNYFNMEAYGVEVAAPALQFFPFAVLIDGRWHLAAFFYESLWDILIFVILWRHRRRARFPLEQFCLYVLLYGAGRLVIEGLRTDSLMSPGGLRVSLVLSALACCGVCLLLLRCARLSRRTRALLQLLAAGLTVPALLNPGLPLRAAQAAGFLLLGFAAHSRQGEE